ncbi:lipase family protein [Antrihabitans sp. YC2-6]|uniref:lipase family protein n=1 Tax=Antrihabitans sp. YC2-6 TaxID=2799498 RepID=UPI0018F6677D|nr:lipase family protein [Antrihabitans sp. YC2-6]MBJ8347804.1 lipase [Antrihabitans sp. YC2-6]
MTGAGIRRTMAILVAVLAIVVAAAPAGSADPIGDLMNPSHDPAALLPTPTGDPFMFAPPGFENAPPGAVLKVRPVAAGPLLTPAASTQLLVRSNDSKGNPIPVATTVLVPLAPWPGGGPRPVVGYNTAIDSLGLDCVPSTTLQRGTEIELVPINMLLSRNYAVVVTDHQGPRQSYAGGRISGHAVLDALRAAVNAPWLGLSPASPIALSGYSGGAIAAGWGAELAPSYAPELNLVGAVMGGAPVDYAMLLGSMNGRNAASGVFLGATLGVAREYPELFGLLNDNGWRLGMMAKDWCLTALAPAGLVAPIPVEALSDVPNVVNSPVAREVMAATRMGGEAPRAPVFLYQGRQDIWIPTEGAQRLYNDWCARGASVQLAELVGEHLIVAVSGLPAAIGWMDDRLAGRPSAPGCSRFNG